MLEGMTARDFQVPLQPKFHGTYHLSEALRNSPLDFFIMLTSLSGTIGSRGQANYAAANTFQDALAHSQLSSKTHYISLNVGMIEGTSAYEDSVGHARSQNLLLQGFIPVKSEELVAFLDYAISPQAREDQCRHAVFGINGRSIHKADDATPTTRSAMFIHVRNSDDSTVRNESISGRESRTKAVTNAHSLVEVHQIIIKAIVDKLANLIALEHEKINLESPLSDFGIDSLNAIQLKNWIAHEFDAAIQASEILDAISIIALCEKVASRSLLVQDDSQEREKLDEMNAQNSSVPASMRIPYANGDQRSTSTAFKLPPLPLPDLESTLKLYLTSAISFLSEDQLKHTSTVLRELQEGLGRQLQKRLLDRTRDPQIDNWQYDLQVDSIYLSRRDPVYPYGIFYGSHVLTEKPHSQVQRAAIICAAAYAFKRRIDASEVERNYLNDEPLCMQSLQWLFNSNRTPYIGKDKMCKYLENEYFVALRRGHFFKVKLSKAGDLTSYMSLTNTFQKILDSAKESLPSVAALSADERDSWAKVREMVKSVDEANDALITMIEAAAFIVCLDEGSPNTPTERCNQFLLGDPSNRWSDKSLQFVVCENGVSAYICEHSMLDAASLQQLSSFITHAIHEHNVEIRPNGKVELAHTATTHYTFTTNNAIENHIKQVLGHFRSIHAPAELNWFYLPTLSNDFLRTQKIPSKTGCQLIIQLASLLYFGQQFPSWETLTTMLFHKGRLDWMQVVSPALFHFCKAAINPSIPLAERQMLLREAAKVHTSTMTRIGRGRGCMAHLEALQEMLCEEDPVPAFFKDPTWKMMHVTSARKIKTDASEGLMVQEAGFLMPDPESLFIHYEIEDEGCRLYIQSTEGRTRAFFEALKDAAETVKDLLEM